jgi:flavin-dependent dehydrogenase
MSDRRVLDVDVLVLGGGPAGAAAARVLATAGASVVMAERSSYDRFCVGETLPPQANLLLARLGVAELLGEAGHIPSPGIVSAWGSDEPHENDFIFSPYGQGWHLDRRRFNESLAHSAAAAGAEVISDARVFRCQRGGRRGWHANLATRAATFMVEAQWIVDATGRAGWLSRSLGIAKLTYDRQVALVRLLDDAEHADPRTFIEAMADGWWYVSALPGRRAIAAFFTDFDFHDLRAAAAKSLWSVRLAASRLASDRLSHARALTPTSVIGCATSQASRAAGDQWLAVGDAARSVDPLSSQGISWAIASGLDAASVVLADDPSVAARNEAAWNQRFQDYLATRRSYYAAERRWSDAPFWHRRSSKAAPISTATPSPSATQKATVTPARTARGAPA